MPNKVRRGEPMDQTIIMRCTQSDKVGLEIACQERGTNVSQLIRTLLIKDKVISPAYPELI